MFTETTEYLYTERNCKDALSVSPADGTPRYNRPSNDVVVSLAARTRYNRVLTFSSSKTERSKDRAHYD